MRTTTMLVVAVMVITGVMRTAQADDDFLFEESFEQSVEKWSADWINSQSAGNNIETVDDGYEGKAAQATILKGQHKGADMIKLAEQFGAKDASVVGITYRLRIDTEFPIESQGKLPGPIGPMTSGGKGGNSCQDETACWSSRLFYSACRNQKQEVCPEYMFGNYMYGPDQTHDTGDFFFADTSLQLKPGKWHCVQIFVDMNTPGKSDGVSMTFVDGQIEQGVTAYAMFRGKGDTSGFRGFWFNFYQGGKDTAKADMSISIDELRISNRLILQPGCLQEVPDLLADEITLDQALPATTTTTTTTTTQPETVEEPRHQQEISWLKFIFDLLRLIGFAL